jgi:hypothetical protein
MGCEMTPEQEAYEASIKMLQQQVKDARNARDIALSREQSQRDSWIRLYDDSTIARWSCPRCFEERGSAGECRDCFIDDGVNVRCVPRAELELFASWWSHLCTVFAACAALESAKDDREYDRWRTEC